MKIIICPVSTERINNNSARITGFLISVLIILFLITQNIWFIIFTALDLLIRSFTKAKYSPISWLSQFIVNQLNLKGKLIDKGQKVFAARIGFTFSFISAVLFYFNPVASVIIASILLSFALLESLLNICAGCLIYTYLVYPFYLNKT